MSFLSKALRRAEVFLEQVDESVAQASRRMVVEGATGDMSDEDDTWLQSRGDPVAAAGLDAGLGPLDAPTAEAAEHPHALAPAQPSRQRRRGLAKIKRAERSTPVTPAEDPRRATSSHPQEAGGARTGLAGGAASVAVAASASVADSPVAADAPQQPEASGAENVQRTQVAALKEPADATLPAVGGGAFASGAGVNGSAGHGNEADAQVADDAGWGDFDFPDVELDAPPEPEDVADAVKGAAGTAVPTKTADVTETSMQTEIARSAEISEIRGGSNVAPEAVSGVDVVAKSALTAVTAETSSHGLSEDKREIDGPPLKEPAVVKPPLDKAPPPSGDTTSPSSTLSASFARDSTEAEPDAASVVLPDSDKSRGESGQLLVSSATLADRKQHDSAAKAESPDSPPSDVAKQSETLATTDHGPFSSAKIDVARSDASPLSTVEKPQADAPRIIVGNEESNYGALDSDKPGLSNESENTNTALSSELPNQSRGLSEPKPSINEPIPQASSAVASLATDHGIGTSEPPSSDAGDIPEEGVDRPLDAHADVDVDPEEFAAVIHENDELRKELEFAEEDFADMLKEKAKHVANLKRLKEVVAEMEEDLEDKSAEVRRLGQAMVDLRDEKNKLAKQLKESVAKGKDSVDLLRKDLSEDISSLRADLKATSVERDGLAAENTRLKDAMTQGREVDMATADDARDLASRAQSAFEQEVTAHRRTREALKEKQEALDADSAVTADAMAAMQRKVDEAIATSGSAKEAQRKAESNLGRVTSARDAAIARVEDLTNELAPYKANDDGQLPGREELASLRQTVSELENALEAKNVELTRLEGEVENMRSVLEMRNESTATRSPGPTASGYEVEQKLRHMADSALRKQAQLEVLRSENKVLQNQLGTERKRTREAQAMAAVATSSRHTLRGGFRGILDAGDEERGERPHGVREGPMARFRTPRGWPTALTKFIGSLDKVCALILGFLRKEPLVRMALLLYVAFMHVLLYGLLHYHVESTLGSDVGGGIHAHPHGHVVAHGEPVRPRVV